MGKKPLVLASALQAPSTESPSLPARANRRLTGERARHVLEMYAGSTDHRLELMQTSCLVSEADAEMLLTSVLCNGQQGATPPAAQKSSYCLKDL